MRNPHSGSTTSWRVAYIPLETDDCSSDGTDSIESDDDDDDDNTDDAVSAGGTPANGPAVVGAAARQTRSSPGASRNRVSASAIGLRVARKRR